jgi:hypothetical protein
MQLPTLEAGEALAKAGGWGNWDKMLQALLRARQTVGSAWSDIFGVKLEIKR